MSSQSTLETWWERGVPVGDWVEAGVEWLSSSFPGVFDGFSAVVLWLVEGLVGGLEGLHFSILIVVFTALAFWLSGWRTALFSALGLLLIVNINLWESFVSTLALVVAAEVFVVLLGLPLGILAGTNKAVERLTKPVLDFMQTMPAFVYLIPSIVFFGIGLVPGIVSTVIFALPPLIRLTSLGIQQVPHDLIEASEAFGSTKRQMLLKVQLPTATPSILAGLNQSIMLGLSMVVIAALVGASGLGSEVLRGVNTLDISLGFEAGLAIVIMAIVLDRITQGLGGKRR